MATTAVKKEVKSDKPDRVICLITGESGTGKSFFIGSLKNALIYDTDLGGGLAYLDPFLKKNGSERKELGTWPDILEDLRIRAQMKTLPPIVVIDHITTLHQESKLRYNPTFKDNFNRESEQASNEWRKVRELIRTCDCNLFCISHTKEAWKNQKATGEFIADGAKKVEGDFHIVIQLEAVKNGMGQKQYPSKAYTMKWRRHPEDPKGPVPPEWIFTLENFERINGIEYQREREGVEFAKKESVDALERVLAFVGEAKATELKTNWLGKAGVDKLSEMTETQIQFCIGKVNAELKGEKK